MIPFEVWNSKYLWDTRVLSNRILNMCVCMIYIHTHIHVIHIYTYIYTFSLLKLARHLDWKYKFVCHQLTGPN